MDHWKKGLLFVALSIIVLLSYFGIYNFLKSISSVKASGFQMLFISTIFMIFAAWGYKNDSMFVFPLRYFRFPSKKYPKNALALLILYILIYIGLFYYSVTRILFG